MNPPREYFQVIECGCGSANPPETGAQRVGFVWFKFIDESSLERMISDGCLGTPPDYEAMRDALAKAEEENENGALEIMSLEEDLNDTKDEIERLKERISELEKQ